MLGCFCCATIPIYFDKLSSKVIIGVFLGYSSTQKGYRIYDIENSSFWFIEMWYLRNLSFLSSSLKLPFFILLLVPLLPNLVIFFTQMVSFLLSAPFLDMHVPFASVLPSSTSPNVLIRLLPLILLFPQLLFFVLLILSLLGGLLGLLNHLFVMWIFVFLLLPHIF